MFWDGGGERRQGRRKVGGDEDAGWIVISGLCTERSVGTGSVTGHSANRSMPECCTNDNGYGERWIQLYEAAGGLSGKCGLSSLRLVASQANKSRPRCRTYTYFCRTSVMESDAAHGKACCSFLHIRHATTRRVSSLLPLPINSSHSLPDLSLSLL